MKSVVCLVIALSAVSSGNEIHIRNNRPFTIWPGILGTSDSGQPENGGFALDANQTKIITVWGSWQGIIWARTNCDESFQCETGSCGDRIKCNGAGPFAPVTTAKIYFGGNDGGTDIYFVTLADGYNLPIQLTPMNGFSLDEHGKYDCKTAGCVADLNKICPDDLSVISGQSTVACMSPCMKFNTDSYCRRNKYLGYGKCKSSDWTVDYTTVFKEACPYAQQLLL